MDSLTLTTVIAAFTMEFGVEIPYAEITKASFDSTDGLVSMVERLTK